MTGGPALRRGDPEPRLDGPSPLKGPAPLNGPAPQDGPAPQARRLAAAWLVLVLLALAIRLAAVGLLAGIAPEQNDRVQRYDPIAYSLLAGEGFSLGGVPTAVSPPVYPLFLAAVYGVFGASEGAARIALAVVDAATVGLVFLLARRLFGTPTAVFAALGAAFLPYSIVQIVYGGSDTLFLLLHTAFLATFVHAWLSGRRGAFAAAGALLGAATLCRAVPLLLPVVLVALLLAAGRAPLRQRAVRAALLALCFSAVVAPWIVRNYLVFDRFVPVQTLGGLHLFLAVHEGGRHPGAAPGERQASLDAVASDRSLFERAVERIREDPGHYLRSSARRLVHMWSRTHSGRYEGWLLAANSALLALAAAGLAMARRRWRLLPLLAVLAYYVALHTVLLAIFRYLLPVVPILLVLAAVPVAALLGGRGAGPPAGSSAGPTPTS
jgi:4-amino-4-deoxy-L-arabinose transferase-like glycosyltransferase